MLFSERRDGGGAGPKVRPDTGLSDAPLNGSFVEGFEFPLVAQLGTKRAGLGLREPQTSPWRLRG